MQDVKNNLEKIIVGATGKVFVTTFANNIYHIKNIVEICEKNNKKIVLQSRTITENIESAQEVGLIGDISRFIIKKEEISKYKNNELVVFISGDEGREFDNITRIVKNPTEIKVEESDTVIMATHPIIHNQRDAQNLKDTLSRLGAHSYHYKYSEMLITNCATFDELKNLHRLLLPKFFMPVYGCHYMLRVHADIERKIGTPENHIIVPDNGMIIEIRDKGTRISNTREKTESEIVVVDGNKIGKLHNVVIKDRETLGAQGVFFAIILLDMRSHKIKKAPDIATRGFIFLKNSQDIINGSRVIISDMMSDYLEKNRHIEIDDIKSDIQISLQKYLMMKTAKEPVVIPLIIKV
jgi:ribonuclease J